MVFDNKFCMILRTVPSNRLFCQNVQFFLQNVFCQIWPVPMAKTYICQDGKNRHFYKLLLTSNKNYPNMQTSDRIR